MHLDILEQIKDCEEQLRKAMLDSDIALLDDLISPDLLFTNHLGQIMTKQDDLDAHRSGILKISKIILSEQKIKLLDSLAIVSAKAKILGSFDSVESENDFRFTRVWDKSPTGNWQIVVGHSSIIV